MNIIRNLLILATLLYTLPSKAADLGVTITNPPATGNIALVIFDSPNAFGDFRDPFRTEVITAAQAENYTVTGLPAGEYALIVFSDENGNQKLDRNFIGIPLEPIGFSRNYSPKGPPQFSHASFLLGEGDDLHMDVSLRRILGKRGTWGIGPGVIFQSSPYRGSNNDVIQPIPSFIYVGDRLQIAGPGLRYALLGRHKNRLAISAQYRVGAYNESDSAYLAGMGSRKHTLMAGLSLVSELPGGINFSLSYQHDTLNRIGGGTAEAGLRKTFQWKRVSFSPSVRINWLSASLARHDFGVRDDQAAPDRPAYDPGSTFSPEIGFSVYSELGAHWSLMFNTGVEFLDSSIRNSPIVDHNTRYKGFLSVFYLF